MQIPTQGPFWDYWSGITILGLVPVILLMVLLIRIAAANSGKAKNLALIGLPIPVFFLIRIASLFITLRPFLDWAWLVNFTSFGIYPYFVAMYVTILAFPDLLSERRWVALVALIGPIAYELVTLIDVGRFASSTSYFTEGIGNYIMQIPHVPFAFLGITLAYLAIYLVVVPMYTMYRYTRLDRIRGTPRVKWIGLSLFGLLLWFIAEAITWGGWIAQTIGGWPQTLYAAYDLGWAVIVGNFEALIPAAVSAISWYLIFIGIVLMERSTQVTTP